jgi:hypothetical protein
MQSGLEAVSRDVQHMPEHLRPLWAQSSLASTADVLRQVVMWSENDGGITAQYIEDLQNNIASGVAVDTPFQCVIGRKAGTSGNSDESGMVWPGKADF